MSPPARVSRWQIQRDIQKHMRTFPTIHAVVFERVKGYDDYNQPTDGNATDHTQYQGEVLLVPAGGNVQRFGLGEVEDFDYMMMIPGQRVVSQGAFTTIESRLYQVTDKPVFAGGYLQLKLKQFRQGE